MRCVEEVSELISTSLFGLYVRYCHVVLLAMLAMNQFDSIRCSIFDIRYDVPHSFPNLSNPSNPLSPCTLRGNDLSPIPHPLRLDHSVA